MKNIISIPGKVLLFGSYAVLIGYKGLAIALNDHKNRGFIIEAREGRGIKSNFFNVKDILKVDKELYKEPAVIAYKTAIKWLKSKVKKIRYKSLNLKGNSIFGTKKGKSGLGGSACVITGVIAALLNANCFDIKIYKDEIALLAFKANKTFSKNASGYDIASSCYGTCLFSKNHDNYIIERINLSHFNDKFLFFNIINRSTDTKKSIRAFFEALNKDKKVIRKLIKQQVDVESHLIKTMSKGNISLIEHKNIKKACFKLLKIKEALSKNIEIYGADPIIPDEVNEFLYAALNDENVSIALPTGAGGYDNIFILLKKEKSNEKIKDFINSFVQDNKGNAKFNSLKLNLLNLNIDHNGVMSLK